jgi:hypothetical protein
MIHTKEIKHAEKMIKKGYHIYKRELIKLIILASEDKRYVENCYYFLKEFTNGKNR